eukprot:5602076-Prymnesium_polylepis.1
MPTTTCCQRPTPTPTSRRPAAASREPGRLARRHVTRPTTITCSTTWSTRLGAKGHAVGRAELKHD